MKEKIFLIGGGGHCHSCIDVLETSGQYEIAGIFDKQENVGKKVLNYPVLGTDADVEKFFHITKNVLITIGHIKNPELRKNLYQSFKDKGANFPVIISSRAYVSKHARIEEGSIIMHDALINAKVLVGKNCIINTKVLLEHDVLVEDFCHIAPAAVLNGNCHVESMSFVGSNAVFKEGVKAPQGSIIAAGTFYKGKVHV